MTRPAHPSDDDVRAAAQQLLADHRAGGSYPSVSTLARRFNINRTTFHRHYSVITDAMLDAAADQQSANTTERRRPPRIREDERDNIIHRLRSENNDLRCHVEIYEEQIRRLTIMNQRLRSQLELDAAVHSFARSDRGSRSRTGEVVGAGQNAAEADEDELGDRGGLSDESGGAGP